MNLEKLRKIYIENPILKEAFEDTFSKDELGLTENKPSSETNTILSQDAFNKAFNNILKGSTQRYLNSDINTNKVTKKKTSRIEVLDKNGNWLLDYDSNPKNPHFWYQYGRVYLILCNTFSLQDKEIQAIMKSLVESQYNLKGVTPCLF
jgi:CTP:phosphocholine cytidylyltransferase-like protein